jgi:hypothetical protein
MAPGANRIELSWSVALLHARMELLRALQSEEAAGPLRTVEAINQFITDQAPNRYVEVRLMVFFLF